MVARLPEPPGELGTRVRIREAVRLLGSGTLRRYLLGVSLGGGIRRTLVPFAIVLMRRVMGLSDAEVLLTTLAYLAGGLASLLLWGRVVDRYGPGPVFKMTVLGISICCRPVSSW